MSGSEWFGGCWVLLFSAHKNDDAIGVSFTVQTTMADIFCFKLSNNNWGDKGEIIQVRLKLMDPFEKHSLPILMHLHRALPWMTTLKFAYNFHLLGSKVEVALK